MKNYKIFLLFTLLMSNLLAVSQEINTGKNDLYFYVGEEVVTSNILSASQMQQRYENLEVGDTLDISFRGKVTSVCKEKGCWMKVDLEDGREVMVKFKDYAFFVPKDIEDKEVIMQGKAYITEMSVEDQQHYAEDAGKSSGEINAIRKPKVTLSFMAQGVKIKK